MTPLKGSQRDMDTQKSHEAENDSFETIAPGKENPVRKEFEIRKLCTGLCQTLRAKILMQGDLMPKKNFIILKVFLYDLPAILCGTNQKSNIIIVWPMLPKLRIDNNYQSKIA
jgi:hypothetical protein